MLTQLLDIFGFLSVLLRGGTLVLAALVVGGVVFGVWILRPLQAQWEPQQGLAIRKSSKRLLLWSAIALVIVQLCYLAADSIVLAKTTGLSMSDVAGANFFIAGLAGAAAAVIIAAIAASDRWISYAALLAPSAVIVGGLAATSHAAGRLEGRAVLLALGAVHVTAVAAWVGGLPYLVLGLARSPNLRISQWLCVRFSRMAVIAVMVLIATAFCMSLAYLDSLQAIYGTAYGIMVGAKAALLGVLLIVGAANFVLVRRIKEGVDSAPALVRRFAEAEVGIGLTIVLAAASLSSQPPAADMIENRLQLSEIIQRFTPQWPRLDTPPVSALSPASPLSFDAAAQAPSSFVPGENYYPNSPGDIAWSEYNHHWAGIAVLAMGLLAFAARWPAMSWARHWPLAFFGLAVFLLLRADPENWPLGPRGFWESFAVPDVLQHRLFVVLIVIFAIFEWGVTTGRVRSSFAPLIFPSVCAAGGALLLTHSHPLGNIKEEVFAELSHVPLAIFAVIAGWSRWLELRAPGYPRRVVAWIWPICFIMIGAILVNYRES